MDLLHVTWIRIMKDISLIVINIICGKKRAVIFIICIESWCVSLDDLTVTEKCIESNNNESNYFKFFFRIRKWCKHTVLNFKKCYFCCCILVIKYMILHSHLVIFKRGKAKLKSSDKRFLLWHYSFPKEKSLPGKVVITASANFFKQLFVFIVEFQVTISLLS